MAKTLLNCVNEVLKRVNIIAGDAAALTTLTDSSRQHPIDLAVQVVNEGIDSLYSYCNKQLPNMQAQDTLTLVTDTREYALASDLVVLHYPFIDRTNTQFIYEYTPGYGELLILDPEQDDTGLPHWAAISPVTGELHLDRAPTSNENGRVYYYQYEKAFGLSAITDTVPFNDAAFRAMVPVWAILYRRDMQHESDPAKYKRMLGQASRYLSEIEPMDSYSPR